MRKVKLSFMVGLVAVVLAVMLLTLSISGCAPAPEKPIKIGVPAQLTGYAASDGADTVAGITMAVDDLNKQGGLLGRPVEMVVFDTKDMSAEDAIAAANRLVLEERVDVVIASYVGTAADIYAFGKYDVPYLQGGAVHVATDIIRDNIDKYWNCFMYSDDEQVYGWQAIQVIEGLPYEFPNKKLAILTQDYQYNVWITDRLRQEVAGRWEVVVDELFPMGTVEWGAQLAKIRAEEPSLIFFAAVSPEDGVTFLNQFLENPTDALIYMHYIPTVAEFMELAGDAANGLLYSINIALLPTPEAKAFAERHVTEFGREPGLIYVASPYDMVMMWAEAVRAVGDPEDYRSICDYFLEHPYTGFCGTYVFDPEDHGASCSDDTVPLHFNQIQEGKRVLFLPVQYKEGDFQLPPWIER